MIKVRRELMVLMIKVQREKSFTVHWISSKCWVNFRDFALQGVYVSVCKVLKKAIA